MPKLQKLFLFASVLNSTLFIDFTLAEEGREAKAYSVLDAAVDASTDARNTMMLSAASLLFREKLKNTAARDIYFAENPASRQIRRNGFVSVASEIGQFGSERNPALVRVIGRQTRPNDRALAITHETRLRGEALVGNLEALQQRGVRITDIQVIHPSTGRVLLSRSLGALMWASMGASVYRLANALALFAEANSRAHNNICFFPELGQLDARYACERDWTRTILTGQRYEPRAALRPNDADSVRTESSAAARHSGPSAPAR